MQQLNKKQLAITYMQSHMLVICKYSHSSE
jgi:hypothetical protein